MLSILVIAIVAILMLTAVLSTAQAVNGATKKVKVTWNANGGKIGAAKITTTTVTKGAKVGKLKTPKKTGYAFKGWYTKKTGGTKITTATKVKKKVIYYAQWKKNANVNIDSKLLGRWHKISPINGRSYDYNFHKNGIFTYFVHGFSVNTGNYKVSNGKITFTNVKYTHIDTRNYPDTVTEYKLKKDSQGNELLEIPHLDYLDRNYLPFNEFYDIFEKWS
jgi:uncharacterized repeat protein (TIGR02543 family)